MDADNRALRPLMNANAIVVGWHCLGCSWNFRVRMPRPLPDYDEDTLRVVEKLFHAHDCANYPERASAAAQGK